MNYNWKSAVVSSTYKVRSNWYFDPLGSTNASHLIHLFVYAFSVAMLPPIALLSTPLCKYIRSKTSAFQIRCHLFGITADIIQRGKCNKLHTIFTFTIRSWSMRDLIAAILGCTHLLGLMVNKRRILCFAVSVIMEIGTVQGTAVWVRKVSYDGLIFQTCLPSVKCAL